MSHNRRRRGRQWSWYHPSRHSKPTKPRNPDWLERELLKRTSKNDPDRLSWRFHKRHIGVTGAKTLANALVNYQTSIESLDLSGDVVGDEGIAAIMNGLQNGKHASSMQRLYLGLNHIGNQGIKTIACKTFPNLLLLDLSDNDIGDDGAIALAETLRTNESLKILRLRGNRVFDRGAEALADMLKTNRSLQTLSLAKNRLGRHGKQCLCDAIQQNCTLEEVSLGPLDRKRKSEMEWTLQLNRAGRCVLKGDYRNFPIGLWALLFERIRNNPRLIQHFVQNKPDLFATPCVDTKIELVDTICWDDD